MSKKTSFSYIDLFAGCGGLSLGLESQGGSLILAVERSGMAAETFFHNLIRPIESQVEWDRYLDFSTEKQVSQRLLVRELRSLLDSTEAMETIVDAEPDLVVGGPPCQGFSLAGRRNQNDLRNELPWQFLTLVEATKPKMVVIENVVGMRHKFSNDDKDDVFNQLQQALRETSPGYVVQGVQVNALHYGAPQHRPRLMIIGLRNDIAVAKNIESTGKLWASDFSDALKTQVPALAPKPTTHSSFARTVGEAISDLQVSSRVHVSDTGFADEIKPESWGLRASNLITNHKDRMHQDKTQMRFRLYQWLASQGIDSRIVGIPSDSPTKEELGRIHLAIAEAKMPAIAPDGVVLAKTFEELTEVICRLRTKKHSQRVLQWDKPARTVVTIGDDYVHPFEPRTFTVRELARFQGFPNGFEFRAKETTGGLNRRTEVPQYSQVGNAVSPFLARAVGALVNEILN